jgi:hypothetical protein
VGLWYNIIIYGIKTIYTNIDFLLDLEKRQHWFIAKKTS